jgi:hypothetical protein
MSDEERRAISELQAIVRKTAGLLDTSSPWGPTLELLATELEEGQPFFFKVAFASSSKSMSDVSALSS